MAVMEDQQILQEIGFGFFGPYPLAGMAEFWADKVEKTLLALKSRGIGATLTLTEDDPFQDSYGKMGVLHAHVPVDDGEAPTIESMDKALAFVNECLAKGVGVAVQCLEGRGRTGTVLCAWLAAKESLSWDQAVARARALRPLIALSPPQKAFLQTYI